MFWHLFQIIFFCVRKGIMIPAQLTLMLLGNIIFWQQNDRRGFSTKKDIFISLKDCSRIFKISQKIPLTKNTIYMKPIY